MKKIITIIVIILVAIGVFYFIKKSSNNTTPTTNVTTDTDMKMETVDETTPQVPEDKTKTVIGQSVEERDIVAYHYGAGSSEILFVGGIHGGYSWNTALVAYQLSDYLRENQAIIPENLKVTVVPVLNPDGLSDIVDPTATFSPSSITATDAQKVSARFNANNVDLNRNFECDWQTNATWRSRSVSGGSSAFSEPESLAIKNYIDTNKPIAAVVWYSSAGGVFASNCHAGVSKATLTLTNVYAKASGYRAYETFDFYEVTGDMVNWLAKNDVPAISVLLTNHTDTEWTKNLKGIEAVLKHYAK